METELISITEYCVNYQTDPIFINSLEESGLLVLTLVEEKRYIHIEQLEVVERYKHLHYDLQINIEGLDAIRHLLDRVLELQQEIKDLRNQLHLND